jgi:photosystem II stability/assembly factor-like uncharacterized protein
MRKGSLIVLSLLAAAAVARAQTWRPLGPSGGDVRSLTADPSRPDRIFLGTADGHVFGSEDAGEHWTLFGRVAERWDAVVTAIVADPRDPDVLFASTWMQDPAAGGGIFRSSDGGRTWSAAGLAGEAVRALAVAPSDRNMLVAGTLDGVYRSRDAGKSWERISPEHHEELRNLDSLAVDPHDSQTIYAGTFHLPWKTTDGGRTWSPIHDGMIDDSDVMSLLVDHATPGVMYASACSGIYRSDNGASQWKKIQGIPYTARRTHVIAQDPEHPGFVYAATSEGLWKTSDAGTTWHRTTPENWVINTIVVPGTGRRGRVVIGTEQLGVLASDDDGEHFHDANAGFFHRQILALAADAAQPGHVLAVLANAPEPVLLSGDGGNSWLPFSPGLRAEQILRVYAAPDGWWASLAHGGLVRYDLQKNSWRRVGALTGEAAATAASPTHIRSSRITQSAPPQLGQVVNDMAFGSESWFAATESGLLISTDQGATWALDAIGPITTPPLQSVRVSSSGEQIWAASLRGIVASADGGKSWSWRDLPFEADGPVSLAVDRADENIVVCVAHNGLYISRDGGQSWQQAGAGLPATPVQDFAISGNVYLASMRTGGLYVSSDTGRTWTRLAGRLAEGFFSAMAADGDAGRIFAASATEGVYAVEWNPSVAVAPSDSVEPRNWRAGLP